MSTTPATDDRIAGTVVLRAGRSKPVRQRHPWVFSGAIQAVHDDPPDGALVDVVDDAGAWLARGYINRRSQITVRLLGWDAAEEIDDDFWRARLARAIAARSPGQMSAAPGSTGLRLVNAESDGLPGLVVDQYDRWLVVQALTLGVALRLPALVAHLVALAPIDGGPAGVFERSDLDVRGKEGLRQATGVLWGEAPPAEVEITEQGPTATPLRFLVDLQHGHKTGFYLDQRENRRRVGLACAGREVLNVFSYSGGFAVHALAAGASRVVNVDASEVALELARRNLQLNGLAAADEDLQAGDAFQLLRRFRDDGRMFDAVILDPPKLAQKAADVDRAARGYKDLNLSALRLLRPGGLLATCSCSGLVSADLFQKIVFGAAVDARRDVAIVGRLTPGADHPVDQLLPEGD
jgi:23S rRNA (cytosine1962-C5)-methyltransferase